MQPTSGFRRIAVAQLGARMHYAVPTVLQRAGLLEAFYTDLCAEVPWVGILRRAIPRPMMPQPLRRLCARTVPGVPRTKIVCFQRLGISRIIDQYLAKTDADKESSILAANGRFAAGVAATGFPGANAIYAYNGAALEALRAARQRDMLTILEQVSAPVKCYEDILGEEQRRWPGWHIGSSSADEWRRRSDREQEEWSLADMIVCGSRYVSTLLEAQGCPKEKIQVLPYAVDVGSAPVAARRVKQTQSPLQVLCVATAHIMKGVQYLIETARLLKAARIRIRLVGPCRVSPYGLAQLRAAMDVAGSLPRDQLHEEFFRADVFVLPTLSEGSAIVCYEALAAALPVVTTASAGSIVRDGIEGRIVPECSPVALADAILEMDGNRILLARMSRLAARRARDFTWDMYGQRLCRLITTGTMSQVGL